MTTIDAVIFDTDGVVTRTAAVHFAAWKTVFDRAVDALAPGSGEFTDAEYRTYVDGIPRYDGVAAFLASRGVELPRGSATDEPGFDTVCAIGNLKNEAFTSVVATEGVQPYATTARFIERLAAAGIRSAVISASRNCAAVLAAAGVDTLFEVRIDGLVADELDLPGKPDPAVFLEAARRLGVEPGRAAVVEDAVAGVEAGRRGGFGLVIGLDRSRHPDPLARHADLVVPDAADLAVTDGTITRMVPARAMPADLPDALDDLDLRRRMEGRPPAVFLDYDGTLTPIVARPEDALLSPESRDVLAALAALTPTGIVSGRDVEDVRALVGLDGLWFAGSHGFDVVAPDGSRHQFPEGRDALPALDAAEKQLGDLDDAFPGAWAERKAFALAVHFRAMDPSLETGLADRVHDVASQHPQLRVTGGKKILELRPAVPWDKGKAVHWLMEAAGLDPEVVTCTFIGDDVTDEDAFVAVRDSGVGVVVGDDDRPTAAHDRLADTDAVRELLARLAAELAAPGGVA